MSVITCATLCKYPLCSMLFHYRALSNGQLIMCYLVKCVITPIAYNTPVHAQSCLNSRVLVFLELAGWP